MPAADICFFLALLKVTCNKVLIRTEIRTEIGKATRNFFKLCNYFYNTHLYLIYHVCTALRLKIVKYKMTQHLTLMGNQSVMQSGNTFKNRH